MNSNDSLSELLQCWRVSPARDPDFAKSVIKRVRLLARAPSLTSVKSKAVGFGNRAKATRGKSDRP